MACAASVSVQFWSKERGTRIEDRAKNGASKRAGKWWGRKEGNFPSPSPLFHLLDLVPFFARTNRKMFLLVVPCFFFLLRNHTETIATQGIILMRGYFCIFLYRLLQTLR